MIVRCGIFASTVAVLMGSVAVEAACQRWDPLDSTDCDDVKCADAECAKSCNSLMCGWECKGTDCATECTGTRCGEGCFGTGCATGCTSDIHQHQKRTRDNQSCGIQCSGDDCATECIGMECGSGCTGTGCAKDCLGDGCGNAATEGRKDFNLECDKYKLDWHCTYQTAETNAYYCCGWDGNACASAVCTTTTTVSSTTTSVTATSTTTVTVSSTTTTVTATSTTTVTVSSTTTTTTTILMPTKTGCCRRAKESVQSPTRHVSNVEAFEYHAKCFDVCHLDPTCVAFEYKQSSKRCEFFHAGSYTFTSRSTKNCRNSICGSKGFVIA